jgi:hypothetical protein
MPQPPHGMVKEVEGVFKEERIRNKIKKLKKKSEKTC